MWASLIKEKWKICNFWFHEHFVPVSLRGRIFFCRMDLQGTLDDNSKEKDFEKSLNDSKVEIEEAKG